MEPFIPLISFTLGILVSRLFAKARNNKPNVNPSEVIQTLKEAVIDDIRQERDKASHQLETILQENNEKMLEESLKLQLLEEKRKVDVDAGIAVSLDNAKAEYLRMEEYFRESMSDDAGTHLITCAYAVVGSNKPPRDISDIDLIRAVMAHKNAGAVDVPGELVKKLPPHGGLN